MESIKELKAICQPQTKNTDSLHVKLICRRFSIYVTKLMLYTPITANQVTLIYILLSLISGLFFLSARAYIQLIGIALLQLSFIFDCVDGEIARYRKTSSITGVYFDRISHAIVLPYIFVCITIGLFLRMQNVWILFFGFSSSLSILLIYLSRAMKYSVPYEVKGMQLSVNSFTCTSGASGKEAVLISSNGINFLRRIIRAISRYPGIMNLLTLAIVLDILAENKLLYLFKFNYVSIFLIFYGMFLPYLWIKTIYNALNK